MAQDDTGKKLKKTVEKIEETLSEVATILSVINIDIGPETNIYLVCLINTLIKGIGLLLMGVISDVVSRQWFLVGGKLFGVIGGIIAATAMLTKASDLASSLTWLDAHRRFIFFN
ncbi:hypothetical protein CC78DRAFT_576353 [Lojkania enalia]|uniref:Major facilitator superfamily (MFS) profile domain-containing protein n=1 Tax=Lojkania enalia TaxID=147567 RepID=A0A9P4KHM3_9PLEO|nr:hypothetical protein CC78DRAFT_576353 [Didymosphaeria enalia]